jgi:hypothetical protein
MTTESLSPAVRVARRQHARMAVAFVLPILVAGVIAGCDNGTPTGPGTAPTAAPAPPTTAPVADTRVHVTATPAHFVPDPPEGAESTAYAVGTVPQFLVSLKDSQAAKITARYIFAGQHPDIMADMPCYCGCAIYQHPHASLQSCFLRSLNSDGTVVYTDHSVTCDICTGEADMVMTQFAAGTSMQQIRDNIHTKYKYTNVWTDTPPIQ